MHDVKLLLFANITVVAVRMGFVNNLRVVSEDMP